MARATTSCEGRKEPPPTGARGSRALPHLASGLADPTEGHFCSAQPPSLGSFVTAAPGGEPILLLCVLAFLPKVLPPVPDLLVLDCAPPAQGQVSAWQP